MIRERQLIDIAIMEFYGSSETRTSSNCFTYHGQATVHSDDAAARSDLTRQRSNGPTRAASYV